MSMTCGCDQKKIFLLKSQINFIGKYLDKDLPLTYELYHIWKEVSLMSSARTGQILPWLRLFNHSTVDHIVDDTYKHSGTCISIRASLRWVLMVRVLIAQHPQLWTLHPPHVSQNPGQQWGRSVAAQHSLSQSEFEKIVCQVDSLQTLLQDNQDICTLENQI